MIFILVVAVVAEIIAFVVVLPMFGLVNAIIAALGAGVVAAITAGAYLAVSGNERPKQN
jgi:hypothetical protein